MLKFVTLLVELLARLAGYFADKQSLDAGAAKQQVAVQKEVEEHVTQAKQAVATPDPVRTERLRNRFDRSRNGE